ncbi:MAG: SGNH/GDSL hydrolase family protein [Alphaproteobacteria bacterium]|nr:SGNH/GDSL hydrolase family protein [Alphaproteobacteria bacterium]
MPSELNAGQDPDLRRLSPDPEVCIAQYGVDVADWRIANPGGGGPLRIVATGDSWFDYPLNKALLGYTDIIAHLRASLPSGTPISNIAAHGDTVANLMGVKRRDQLKRLLAHGADVILFSGGGNDIAGDQFRNWLDSNPGGGNPAMAINDAAVAGILAIITAGYRDLIALRDQFAPQAHILLHGYDFAYPDNRDAKLLFIDVAGPWLFPSLKDRGWMQDPKVKADLDIGCRIVKTILTRFNSSLVTIAAQHPNVTLVPTQGTLTRKAQWDNELHPGRDGFALVAAKFVNALTTLFPTRRVI